MSQFKVPIMDASGNTISLMSQVFEVNYNHAVYNEIVQTRKLLESLHIKLDTLMAKKKPKKTSQ